MTHKFSLTAAAHQHLDAAKRESAGRSAQTLVGGHEHVLRHTVITLAEGRELHEHNSPGQATPYVLSERARLSASDLSWDASTGDLIIIPARRHALHARTDTAVLLTVAQTITPTRTTNPNTAREERT